MQALTAEERDGVQEAINMLVRGCHQLAVEKGWWDTPLDTIQTKLLLIVTEVAEAAELLREPVRDSHALKTEVCDILIRAFDLLGRLDGVAVPIPLHGLPTVGSIFADKFEYNMSRPPRHGKQF